MAMEFCTVGLLLSRRFFWTEKNLPGFFRFKEIRKKPKIHILAPTAKNEFNGRNFYYTWIQLILFNNWQQFGSNRRQKIFGRKPCTPPFYLIFTSENHLNAHSSLIKPHMAMNFAPLDCSCQALLLSRKNLPGFFRFREIRKKTKKYIFWLLQQKWVQWPETFTIPEFNSSYSITDSNLVRIGDKKFLEENHVLPPSI
jgi:hypothetical protein